MSVTPAHFFFRKRLLRANTLIPLRATSANTFNDCTTVLSPTLYLFPPVLLLLSYTFITSISSQSNKGIIQNKMDSLATTASTTTTTETEMPLPPPYTPPTNLSCFYPTEDGQEEEDEEEETTPSTNITFNSPITIHGHNNIVSFSSADFTRMAAMIVATVQKSTTVEPSRNININVNCGITVVGQRNLIGNGGIRPMALRQQMGQQVAAAAAATTTVPTGTGASSSSLKRKAEEVGVSFFGFSFPFFSN
jgi:hypothetical protein